MKLSVIVPVYNGEAFLSRCIESVLNQTLGDLELILVNDGSTDGSERVIDDYKSRFPGKIKSVTVENGGQGRARNIGIEMACGEYLGFVDGDDWVDARMYEKLYAAAVGQDADIAMCDFMAVFPDGRTALVPHKPEQRDISAAGSACNKIFRAAALGDVRFPVGIWYEDFEFSARLLAASGKTVSVFQPLYFYRCGHASTMNNDNSRRNLEIITVLKRLEGYLSRQGRRDDFEYLLINHVLIDAMNRVAAQKSPDKSDTLAKLHAFAHEQLPRLRLCGSYRAEPRKRRIIMALNYNGLYALSGLLLALKRGLQRGR